MLIVIGNIHRRKPQEMVIVVQWSILLTQITNGNRQIIIMPYMLQISDLVIYILAILISLTMHTCATNPYFHITPEANIQNSLRPRWIREYRHIFPGSMCEIFLFWYQYVRIVFNNTIPYEIGTSHYIQCVFEILSCRHHVHKIHFTVWRIKLHIWNERV